MRSQADHYSVTRYRGFLLFPEYNNNWLVRPERSPMAILPFRTNACSVDDVKQMIDLRLEKTNTYLKVA